MTLGGSVSLGGSGGSGNSGGNVVVTSSGDIETGLVDENGTVISGDFAYGLLAQSVGGGGGTGGTIKQLLRNSFQTGKPISLGANIAGSVVKVDAPETWMWPFQGSLITVGDLALAFLPSPSVGVVVQGAVRNPWQPMFRLRVTKPFRGVHP